MFNHAVGPHAPGHGPQISHDSDKESVFSVVPTRLPYNVHRYATQR
jgi:hypothetical protein